MKSKKTVKWIIIAIWVTVFLLGLYAVFYGFKVMNAQERIETKPVSAYVRYSNGIIAGNLTIYLTSVGPITPGKWVNASIDLYWLYIDESRNTLFSIYFWDANPKPEFPFNATMPPPTPRIYLLNLWWMPKNHFKPLNNVTLVWMTSGIKGITIEEISTPPPRIEEYNVPELIEVEPASAATRFREAHTSEGQWWIGIGIAIVFGSTLVYEVAEHLRKTS